jgi:hypothetical protein
MQVLLECEKLKTFFMLMIKVLLLFQEMHHMDHRRAGVFV